MSWTVYIIVNWSYTSVNWSCIEQRFTLVTPLNMFWMWLHTVLTAANSLRLPNHLITLIFFLPSIWISTAKCLNVLDRDPLGPLTITFLDLTLTSTVKIENIFLLFTRALHMGRWQRLWSSDHNSLTFFQNRQVNNIVFYCYALTQLLLYCIRHANIWWKQ